MNDSMLRRLAAGLYNISGIGRLNIVHKPKWNTNEIIIKWYLHVWFNNEYLQLLCAAQKSYVVFAVVQFFFKIKHMLASVFTILPVAWFICHILWNVLSLAKSDHWSYMRTEGRGLDFTILGGNFSFRLTDFDFVHFGSRIKAPVVNTFARCCTWLVWLRNYNFYWNDCFFMVDCYTLYI